SSAAARDSTRALSRGDLLCQRPSAKEAAAALTARSTSVGWASTTSSSGVWSYGFRRTNGLVSATSTDWPSMCRGSRFISTPHRGRGRGEGAQYFVRGHCPAEGGVHDVERRLVEFSVHRPNAVPNDNDGVVSHVGG